MEPEVIDKFLELIQIMKSLKDAHERIAKLEAQLNDLQLKTAPLQLPW